MKYTEWQQLTEAFGARSLGLSNRQVLGGPIGSQLQENPLDLKKKDELGDEEDELDDEELEDEEGGEEEDLLGDEPEGPEKGFPPDDSEDMDGLPTPDEEMLDDPAMGGEMGDEMGDTLAGIDPDLAGLGGEEEMGMEEMPPELGDEMGGEEMGMEMEPELGDEMGMEMEPEMGGELDAAEIPCMDCNPEGEMEEGDPDCMTCGGEGFVTDDQAEMPEEPGDVDAELVEDDPEAEMMDLMARMQDYCKRYMPDFSKKFMDKDDCCKGCSKAMDKCMCKKENNEFLAKMTKRNEDALLTPEESEEETEPQAGDVGFAPQGRVGSIGGGYTMDDFQDIPTLGESVNYPSWKNFLSKKEES